MCAGDGSGPDAGGQQAVDDGPGRDRGGAAGEGQAEQDKQGVRGVREADGGAVGPGAVAGAGPGVRHSVPGAGFPRGAEQVVGVHRADGELPGGADRDAVSGGEPERHRDREPGEGGARAEGVRHGDRVQGLQAGGAADRRDPVDVAGRDQGVAELDEHQVLREQDEPELAADFEDDPGGEWGGVGVDVMCLRLEVGNDVVEQWRRGCVEQSCGLRGESASRSCVGGEAP